MAEYARAQAEASRARQEQSRRQASDERLQIARELHDVLGHHLSLINVRAGVGLHLIDARPEEARAALEAIKTASAEALREVRGVLAALAPDDPRPPDEAGPPVEGAPRADPGPGRRADRWPTTPGRPGCRSPSTSPVRRRRCRPRSTGPPTGSCRRR